MKKIHWLLVISLFQVTGAFAQQVYQIRADSVRIYNVCDTAELIIENRTRGIAGFLYNKGNGRTEFRKLQLETIGNNRLAIAGQDTIDISTLAAGIDTIFRVGDSIRYQKSGNEHAVFAPLPRYFTVPVGQEYGYYQFPAARISGFDAYNSPDMPPVSDQALANPDSGSSYYTGHVVSNGSVGYQMAVNWDGELTGPKGVFLRTKDDTETTWSAWRELLFKDYADNKYQLSGSGGGGQDSVIGNSELMFMVAPSKKSFITGPYDSSGTGNVGIGYNARTPGFNSVAIGNGALTNVDDGWQQGAVAIGTNAKALSRFSVAIGHGALTNGPNSISIGSGAKSALGVAIGLGVRDDGAENIGVGQSISTYGSKNIVIGQDYRVEGDYNVLLGANTGSNPDTIRGFAKFFAFFQRGFDFQSDTSFTVSEMIYKNRLTRNTYFKTTPIATSIGTSNIAQTSRLNVNGSLALPIKKVTTPYTIAGDDYNVVSTTSGTITLPSATTATQRMYVLKNASADTVTLITTASQKIKSQDTDTVTSIIVPAGEDRTLQSDGTDWVVKDVPPPPVITSPAGTDGLLQFNNGGTFGASPSLRWEESTKTLNLGTSTIYDSCTVNIGGSHPQIKAVLNSASTNFNITGSKNITATAGQNMTMNARNFLTINTTTPNGTIKLSQNGVEKLSVSDRISMNGSSISAAADRGISLGSSGANVYIDSAFSVNDATGQGLYLNLDYGVNLFSNYSMLVSGYTDATLEGYEKVNINGKKIGINSGEWYEERILINENGEVGIGTSTPVHKLDVAGTGGFERVVTKSVTTDARVISSNTTLNNTYSLIEADNSAAITVNLPSANSSKGMEYTIIKSSNNAYAVTIQAAGSDTINGNASFALSTQWKTVTVWSSGLRWLVKYSN